MQDKYSGKVEVVASSSADEAVTDSDIIVLVTTSKNAIINGDKLKKGALVCGVGSYMPTMHEIDEKTLIRADKIYFDSKDAVLSEAGCIITPLKEGKISEDKFTGDLGDMINGNIVSIEYEIIVFKSVGISTQDLVTGKAIYDKAIENKVGYEF